MDRGALALTVLGSGSAGNCSALTVGGGARPRLLLVDAGLSPRMVAMRLGEALGRRPDEATDLILTHLDGDHWRASWRRVVERHGIRVRVHAAHVRAALAAGVPERSIHPLAGDEEDLGDGLRLEPTRAPHDAAGSTAFVVEWASGRESARLGFATDLGRVPDGLFDRFRDLDLVAFESNYDPALQDASGRPEWLKARIRGGRGHLSNEAALRALARIDRAGELRAIVLLHLSRECNRRELVEELWRREAPHLADRLVVAEQSRPAPTVAATPRPRPRRDGEIASSLFPVLT